MSFDLLLPLPATLAAVLDAAPEVGAVSASDPDIAAVHGVRLFLPERSIRGVAIVPVRQGLALRLPPLPAPADVELAIALAATVAERHDLAIVDAGTLRRPDGLRRAWPPSRCQALAEGAAARLLADIDAGGMSVPGVQRDLWIGPELKAALRGSAVRLLARARRAQWLGDPPPHEPAVQLRGRARVAEVRSDRSILLRSVDLVALPGPSPCIVPVGHVVQELGDAALRLDEHTWLLEAIAEGRWPALRARVLAAHVPVPEAWSPVHAADQLFPVLRPADWPGRDTALCWGLTERDDEVLWVSLVRDEGASLRPVLPSGVEAQRRGAALDRAVRNLEARLPSWEVERSPQGGAIGLTLHDAMATEALLSARVLHVAHELLGSRALVAAAPIRGMLRLHDAYPTDPTEVAALARWAERSFAEAAARPELQRLSPRLLVIVDGRVQGPLRVPGEERLAEEGSLDLSAVVSGSSDSPALAIGVPVVLPAPPSTAVHPALASLIVPGLGQMWRGDTLSAGVLFGLEIGLFVAIAVGWMPLALGPIGLVVVHGVAGLHAWWRER